MSYFSQFLGLPRQVYILCLVRWISGMGSLVFTFSSLILTGMVGLTTKQAGIVAMLYATANVVGAIVGGKMADFYGRKKIYLWFTVVTCCFYVLGSFYCTTIWIVPISICAFFFGSGCYPIVSAMVADSAEGPKSAECFSLLYLSHNLGFAVGPALGGALLADHLPWVYRIQAGMFLFAALILYICTIEVYKVPTKEERAALRMRKKADHYTASEPESTLHESTLKMLLQTKILLIFIVTLAIATTLYCGIGFILPLQFKDALTVSIPVKTQEGGEVPLQLLFIANSQKKESFRVTGDVDEVEGIDSREIIIEVFNRCKALGDRAKTLFIGAMGTNGLAFPYEVVTSEILNCFVYAQKMKITPTHLYYSIRQEDMQKAGITVDEMLAYIGMVVHFFRD